MPTKTCGVCYDLYFGRWGNTPAVCETCALSALMCPACWTVRLVEDPTQLALFAPAAMARVGAWWSVDSLLADHFANRPPRNLEREDTPPWPRRASQATRQKYPYH